MELERRNPISHRFLETARPKTRQQQSRKSHNTVPAVITLAWRMQGKSIAAPIASATSLEQLSQIIKSVDTALAADEVTKLNDASAY